LSIFAVWENQSPQNLYALKNRFNSIGWLKACMAILGILGLSIIIIEIFSFSSGDIKNSAIAPSTIIARTPYIPDKISFSGEEVPLKYFDVYESLEKEIIINAYWHSQTILYIKKANRYFPIIEPILKANNIPDDFKYLVVAESGFSDVVSPAGAAGFWHFLENTAREYGLEVNQEVDERYNLEKATNAACRYFIESYTLYKSWTMVAASYNGGRNGIDKQISRQGENNFYDLLFTEETQRYIFRILAFKTVMEHPELYGFILSKDELYKPIPYNEMKINGSIEDMGSFAKQNGTNYKILKFMNPWLRDIKLTNPQKKEYTIKIPLTDCREL
jgi:membrane-bound lytic murein transglycosylase D